MKTENENKQMKIYKPTFAAAQREEREKGRLEATNAGSKCVWQGKNQRAFLAHATKSETTKANQK